MNINCRKRRGWRGKHALAAAAAVLPAPAGGTLRADCPCTNSLGLFEAETDIAGRSEYDPFSACCRISGSGENSRHHSGAFHFVWKEIIEGARPTAGRLPLSVID